MAQFLTLNKAKAFLIEDLQAQGFDQAKIVRADNIGENPKRLAKFIEANFHASMDWLSETQERRGAPKQLWEDAKSVVMVAMSYSPDESYDPLQALKRKNAATISCYAQNRDYHDIMKGKLKQAAGRFVAKTGAQVKVFVDTAPVMEKPLAQKAGLGWQGKHTNLVSRELGSWFFLGSIFTDVELPEDIPEIDHCGSCCSCLDICPTDAFPAPYQLDAGRCISYLTIEHDGPIAREFRKPMGNRIYGCDDCLAVCPWNKFATAASEAKLVAREDLKNPPLAQLLGMDDAAFRKHFSGSPIKRIGRNRFIRNCLIAAGNSQDLSLVPQIKRHIADEDPTIRGAAVWALGELMDADKFAAFGAPFYGSEQHASVVEEWTMASKGPDAS